MATPHTTPTGTPCWADLWTSDVEASRRFYPELFGWKALEPSPEFGGYWMFERDGAPVAGGMGSMPDLAADNAWKPYFATHDIDATIKRAEAGGASVLGGGAMPIADLGVQAFLNDPAGAGFGLWQAGTFAGFGNTIGSGAVGAPSWVELNTRDHAGALAFYTDLFGYETSAVSDTDQMRYFTFRAPGTDTDLGGIMDGSPWMAEGTGDHWAIYWRVDDTAAATRAAKGLGATVVQGPDPTPYGVLAQLNDPAGAMFKLQSPPFQTTA